MKKSVNEKNLYVLKDVPSENHNYEDSDWVKNVPVLSLKRMPHNQEEHSHWKVTGEGKTEVEER